MVLLRTLTDEMQSNKDTYTKDRRLKPSKYVSNSKAYTNLKFVREKREKKKEETSHNIFL